MSFRPSVLFVVVFCAFKLTLLASAGKSSFFYMFGSSPKSQGHRHVKSYQKFVWNVAFKFYNSFSNKHKTNNIIDCFKKSEWFLSVSKLWEWEAIFYKFLNYLFVVVLDVCGCERVKIYSIIFHGWSYRTTLAYVLINNSHQLLVCYFHVFVFLVHLFISYLVCVLFVRKTTEKFINR